MFYHARVVFKQGDENGEFNDSDQGKTMDFGYDNRREAEAFVEYYREYAEDPENNFMFISGSVVERDD